jgi:hypothetical protein
MEKKKKITKSPEARLGLGLLVNSWVSININARVCRCIHSPDLSTERVLQL